MEGNARWQLPLSDQPAAERDVQLGKILKPYARRRRGAGGDGVKHVAAMAGGDIDDVQRPAGSLQGGGGGADQLLQMNLALPDAAPADRVEKGPVDHAADRADTLRLVLVDIVERRTGIEAGGDPRLHAGGKPGAHADRGAADSPIETSRRKQIERRCEPVGLIAGVAGAVGIEEIDWLLRRLELFFQERPDEVQRLSPVALAQRVVEEAGQHMPLLGSAAEIDEEFVLRSMPHYPVAAGDKQLRRHGNSACIGDNARGMAVELDQDVGGDRPGDQRVHLERGDALRVMCQKFRLDVGIDEEAAFDLLPKRNPLFSEGHVELYRKGRRGDHQRADLRRVIVYPSGGKHGAEGLGDQRDIALAKAISADLAHQTVDVAHQRGKGRRIAAFAGRAPVAARIPSVKGAVGHFEFIDEMGQAAAMLVTAVKQYDRTLAVFRNRRPVTIEDFGAVMRRKQTFLCNPLRAFRDYSGIWLLKHCFLLTRRDFQPPPALRPLRIRLMAVTSERVAIAGNTKAAMASTHRPEATRTARMPSASARSLLPNGPA